MSGWVRPPRIRLVRAAPAKRRWPPAVWWMLLGAIAWMIALGLIYLTAWLLR